MRRFALALVLLVCAVGALAVSLSSRYEPVMGGEGWTMYTPISDDAAFDEYDHMPWNDARLWLGAAIGLGAAGLAVGAASLRRAAERDP